MSLLVTASFDQTIAFWDEQRGETFKTIELPQIKGKQIANRLQISLDKVYLGAACSLGVRIYDLNKASSTATYNFESYTNNVTGCGFQRDCKWVYACSEDGSIKIHDLRAQGFQRNYNNKEAINCIALHPNEAEVIIGDQSGNIKVYDLVADKCRKTLSPSPDIGIRALSIALNACLVVSVNSNGGCFTWSIKNDEIVPLEQFGAHEDYILQVATSPNIKSMATCSADKTIKLWDIDDNGKVKLDKVLYGHGKWVWDCVYSCDSEYLISCSSDQLAIIWRTDTGDVIRKLYGHKKGVVCIALNDIFMEE